jgi:hypothetical protein
MPVPMPNILGAIQHLHLTTNRANYIDDTHGGVCDGDINTGVSRMVRLTSVSASDRHNCWGPSKSKRA